MDSYEKKDKETVRKIRKAYLYAQTDSTKAVLKEIIPELAESEDEKIKKELKHYLEVKRCQTQSNEEYIKCNTFLAWLEKQKPVEWSEEDEVGLGDALWAIKQARTIAKDENDMGNLWYAENWLKSLRPHNHWKPSELQLGCLSDAIEYYNSSGYPAPKLKELYEQLKKLKEE